MSIDDLKFGGASSDDASAGAKKADTKRAQGALPAALERDPPASSATPTPVTARTIEVAAMFPIGLEYNGTKVELHLDGSATGDVVALEHAMTKMQRGGDAGLGSIIMWMVLNVMKGQLK